MRTTQANICAGDSCHTDEIISAAEESCKGRGKGNLVTHAHTYSSSYQLFFRDILLKIPLREGFGKFFSIGRIADLSIQANHVRIGGSKRLQRITISFAR